MAIGDRELVDQVEQLELVTSFRGYSKGFRTNHQTGEALLSVAAPLAQRDAMEVLDKFPGYMFTITVWRKVRRRDGPR